MHITLSLLRLFFIKSKKPHNHSMFQDSVLVSQEPQLEIWLGCGGSHSFATLAFRGLCLSFCV